MKQVLLVTGGSRGIGAATALLAARNGYAVAVNYAGNERRPRPWCADRAAGGHAFAVQADVARGGAGAAMFEQVDARLGRLTALVNNAGIVDAPRPARRDDVDRLQRMFDINVLGTFLCAREAVSA